MLVSIHHGASRELVVVLFTVEAFLDATVVFLTLDIALTVLKEDAAARLGRLFPVVAVVGVEVPSMLYPPPLFSGSVLTKTSLMAAFR